MTSILDNVIDATNSGPSIVSSNNDVDSINLARGLGDVLETMKIEGRIKVALETAIALTV